MLSPISRHPARFPIALTALVVCFLASVARPQSPTPRPPLPLVASYAMEPDPADPHRLVDSGPLGLHGKLDSGVRFDPAGRRGGALHFSGEGDNTVKVSDHKLLDRIGAPLTVAFWLKADAPAADGTIAAIVTKREGWWSPTPFTLSLGGGDGALILDTYNGRDGASGGRVLGAYKVGEWVHVAITFQADGERVIYLNGEPVSRGKLEGSLAANDQPLVFGYEKGGDFPGGGRSKFRGLLDEVHLYAAALTPDQVKTDMGGAPLPARAAAVADFVPPSHYVHLWLTRWDQPLGFAGRISRTRQTARREPGPDAVDWPAMTLRGDKVFEQGADEAHFYPLRRDPENRPLFHQGFDDACTLEPGGHWFRTVEWLWGRRYVYTSDRTARGAERDFEIWTFPVRIEGAGGDADVRSVLLRCNGQTLYQKDGPWRSLTLLLPQNTPGQPYELTVNGRGPVRFDAGLQPVVLGDPVDQPIVVDLTLPGEPAITVRSVTTPRDFPNPKEWQADLAAVAALRAEHQAGPDAVPLAARLDMEPEAAAPGVLPDAGPAHLRGELRDGATLDGEGRRGRALRLAGGGGKACAAIGGATLNPLGAEVSFAAWIKPDALPTGDNTAVIVTKRAGWFASTPFSLLLLKDGGLRFEGDDGTWEPNLSSPPAVQPGQWQHVAFTYRAGGEEVIYCNGQPVARRSAARPLKANDYPLVLGYQQGGNAPGMNFAGFGGLIDDARVYAAALTPAQVAADMDGTLRTRAASAITGGGAAVPAPFVFQRQVRSFKDYVGVEVPRSPLAIHTVNMTHGMSGGHFYGSEHGPGAFNGGGAFPGTVEDYAAYLADLGYDRVFERVNDGVPAPQDARSYEHWLAALAARGVQGGLNLVALNDANLAFYSYALPDFNRPRLRDAQLLVQRFAGFPNLAGASIGADNAGYVPYWDWSPATPERPWGEAFAQFQQGRPPRAPVPPGMTADKDYEYPTPSMREFLDYIARYDESFKRYGAFARAVREVDPRLAFTTQSFGSSPGVGAHGGYRWASIPGLPMHDGVPVLQSYDWDETVAAKPLHNVALIDRLKSYYPEKPAWALLDDFMLKYGREPRQRAFALALTRGIQSVGPNWLAHTAGKFARPQIAADEKELYAWCHRYGGVYALTQPQASVGVLYVHDQAVARRSDAKEPRSPHEGKTTEALFLCHAAGWPAKIVTPEELRRGLPAGMNALLLVGLNQIDESWHWYDGLGDALAAFTKRGGRLLLDDESASPPGVPAVQTEMAVRAYVAQGDGTTDMAATDDKTPALIERNAANIARLRDALRDAPPPFGASDDPTVWAVPTTAGDVQYLTVVNQGSTPGRNATQFARPQTGRLRWKTDRPIYDVRARKRVSPTEAAVVDLTHEGFQWYALPPAEVTAPRLRVEAGADGFYTATADVGKQPMRGIPVEFTVTSGGESATVYGVSGVASKLPIPTATAGDYAVKAAELLTGLEDRAAVRVPGGGSVPPSGPATDERLARFLARRDVPLCIALTPAQAADAGCAAFAKELAATLGPLRKTEVRRIEPGDVVRSLQPVSAAQPFPRWHTLDGDLVLLGSPADNPLLLDQARGYLLPASLIDPVQGNAAPACVTYSPFNGGYDALNLAGDTPAQRAAHLARLRAAIASSSSAATPSKP